MKDFAKIFKRGRRQVLVQKALNDESEACIQFTVELSFGFATTTLCFKSEDTDGFFGQIDEEKAFHVVKTLLEMDE